MNTLLLTIIFLINVLFVSNESYPEFEYMMDKSKRYNIISYEKILNDSHMRFQKMLKFISKNQNKVVLSIETLIYLLDRELITFKQAEQIWSYLALNSENVEIHLPEITRQDVFTRENTFEYVPSLKEEEKRSFSFYQTMFLIVLGYVVVVFFILIIFIALYQKETYILLCFASAFLSYNFLNYARILKFQLNADFIPSLFFNTSFCFTNLIMHFILIKLNLEKKMSHWTDIFAIDETFKAKLIHSILNLFLSYNLAFSGRSGFIQIPFFFSIYYTFYLISCKTEQLLSKRLWPSWLFTLSSLSMFMMHYIYTNGRMSFIFVINKNGDEPPDFQFIGYIFCVLILNTLLPVYLYIQHQKLWKIYHTNEFSYKLVFKKFKEEISKDVLVFNLNMFCYHFYAVVIIALIYFGLKIKMFLMVVIPSFALQSYMGFVIKDERMLWVIFFYAGSLYALNSVYLLGRMEDKLSAVVLGEFKDSLLVNICEIFCKLMLIYYSMEAITTVYATKDDDEKAENESEKEKEKENKVNYTTGENDENQDADNENDEDLEFLIDFMILFIKFLLHYAFGVYLYAIANEESSIIMSIAYMIFALISFSKLLIYSSLTKDEMSRNLISILIYAAALRLSIFPGKYQTPLYFGSVLSNLCVFALYISFKNVISLLICLFLIAGLFIHSFLISSNLGMLLNLINISLFIAFFTAKNSKGIFYNFLALLGFFFIIIILNQGFDIYFKIVDVFMKKFMPTIFAKFIANLQTLNNLRELEIMKNIINACENYFFAV